MTQADFLWKSNNFSFEDDFTFQIGCNFSPPTNWLNSYRSVHCTNGMMFFVVFSFNESSFDLCIRFRAILYADTYGFQIYIYVTKCMHEACSIFHLVEFNA